MLLMASVMAIISMSVSNYFLLPSLVFPSAMIWLLMSGIVLCTISMYLFSSSIWLLMSGIVFFTFFSSSLLVFYMLFEMSLSPVILLILYLGSQPERLSATLYFIIYTGMFSIPFLVFVLFFRVNFNLQMKLYLALPLIMMMLLPFFVKMPVFGLHFWLPKAHVEANTSGSMILAGVLLKLGSYGVIRMVMIFSMNLKALTVFWLSTSLFSSFVTFFQSDMKKLAAYSSVTHMTFMMISLSDLNKIIMMIVISLSLVHGWASMGMFSTAGALSGCFHSRLNFLSGSSYKLNWFVILFGLILTANASLPPFPSFFSEILIVAVLVNCSWTMFLFIGVSFFVCYYNAYLFLVCSHFSKKEASSSVLSISELMKLEMILILSLVSLGFIFLPN